MLSKDELKNTIGGAITASWLSAISKGINSLLELGRSFGSSIRRIQTGNLC